MTRDSMDTAAACVGFGERPFENKMIARIKDKTADPIASTTATELMNITPSKPIGGKPKYVTLYAKIADIIATLERNLASLYIHKYPDTPVDGRTTLAPVCWLRLHAPVRLQPAFY